MSGEGIEIFDNNDAPTLEEYQRVRVSGGQAWNNALGALSVSAPNPSERPVENWQDYANCLGIDPDLFFPEQGVSTRAAKEVCRACVVRVECLEFALANGEKFGIWGGMSERERRRARRNMTPVRVNGTNKRNYI